MKVLRNEGFEGAKRADTVLKRQGALLGAGLLDAGGRNTVLQLMGVGGLRREAAVSVFLGCQVWEWYPLVQIMVKALVPTMVIGVDSSLHMPKDFQLRCDQPESRFAYVEPVKKEEKTEKTTVTFSFQEKPRRAALQSSLRRSSTRGVAESESKTDKPAENAENADMPKKVEASEASGKETTETTEEKKTAEGEAVAKAEEPKQFMVPNGNRVTLTQMPHMSLLEQRFMPVVGWERIRSLTSVPGVLVVKDTQEGACQYVDVDDGERNVIECPKPFTYHIVGTVDAESWIVCEQTEE